MATMVLLPKLGVTMEEGKIVNWCKQEGEEVAEGDILFEIETDKVTMEVEAREAGILRKILIAEGETVPVTTPVAIIGSADEDISELLGSGDNVQTNAGQARGAAMPGIEEERPGAAPKDKPILATPRAKKLAREKGVDLSKIEASGENGRIIEEDVMKYLESTSAQKDSIPLEGIRKIIAERLSRSAQERPHVYFTREIDMATCLKLKEELNYKVTLTDFFVYAVSRALREYPAINVTLAGDEILRHAEVNVGIAVDAGKGLIVPVIKNADKKSLQEIAAERTNLVQLAREGKLIADQVEGGTFTVSNLGMYGVDEFTTIINPPESAILAVGATKKRLVVSEEGDIRIRPVAKVTLAVDHRVIDGALAARFLQAVTGLLENISL
ncbi:Single hybrid motif [Moorella glycerini]|uniref:Dihydrolipoamide acetyltransferase component of pyruvate dehydrogenase complex n=2 Tax=Neomoorella stamsii TaxID=1266720 RepID=A0A9X7P5Y5_9FIRM|nr:Dihydrolipoyllysine-residue acetyltransferase component of pyruvate dehydrogenase complex [Moorella stamsii]CEP67362.1 Single hybrid motif [Moorella glycerini]